jgi:hypothetical protein
LQPKLGQNEVPVVSGISCGYAEQNHAAHGLNIVHSGYEMKPGAAAELAPLAESVSPEDLERIFGAFGKVSGVDIQKRRGTRIAVITYVSR